ncbi:MAG TPA: GTPase ObgE [Candidatus Dormibacteraeota bacterium]|nr:GTPase ObgE [Candidatus Dormibacteraeota bacterium]
MTARADRRAFVDTARIVVRGGHGGPGSASFRREPFTPRGGPDGGDGGRGGSVVLHATDEATDLSRYIRRRQWHAEAGARGAAGRKTGKNAPDLTLDVPVGTLALDAAGMLIADLDRADAKAVVAKGGAGGRGNVHFKSSTRQAPDFAEPGLGGEEREITLDLKLIADAGLVGPPNAGKSSLLAAMTAARPKVANYPFTTLQPELGVAEVEGMRFVLADIPGLIEGAARGAGLGHRFLRHVERTRALVYVLDGTSADPWRDLETVRAEMADFSPELIERPHLVVVNKVDLEAARHFRARARRRGVQFVSALTGEGVDALKTAIARLVASAPAPRAPAPAAAVTTLRPRGDEAPVVERTPGGFVVSGAAIERLLERTDLESDGGFARFQSALDRMGVNRALEAAGVQPGDTVRIAGVEFEYRP